MARWWAVVLSISRVIRARERDVVELRSVHAKKRTRSVQKRSSMNKAVMDDHEEVFFKTFGAHGLNFCITPHENLGRYFLAESTVLFMFYEVNK